MTSTSSNEKMKEVEELVLRLRKEGAQQISVTLDKVAISVIFPTELRATALSSLLEVEKDKQANTSRENEQDLAYWSSND